MLKLMAYAVASLVSFSAFADMYSGPFITCGDPNTGGVRSYIENRAIHFVYELKGTYGISLPLARKVGLPEGMSRIEFSLNAEECLFNEVQFRLHCPVQNVAIKFSGVDQKDVELNFERLTVATTYFGTGLDTVQILKLDGVVDGKVVDLEDKFPAVYSYGAAGGSGYFVCERRVEQN